MLVLTRKVQQSIRIGDGITVTVIRVRNSKVKLGFDCPREISIRRFELTANQSLGEQEQKTRFLREGQTGD